MSLPQFKMATDVPRTIDLRASANLFQVSLIVLFALVGAIVAYQSVQNGRWIAAAGGGTIGMLSATLVSGFALLFRPQSISLIDAQASVNKYRRIHRRLAICAYFYWCWAVVAIGWLVFGLPVAGRVVAVWSIPMLVCYVLLHHSRRVLDLWRCPNCDEQFGRYGAFAKYPHTCRECGFAIDRHDTVAGRPMDMQESRPQAMAQ